MKPKVVSQTIQDGKTQYRYAADGSWQVLAFGSFPFQTAPGLTYQWITIPENRVPREVKTMVGAAR